MFTCACCVPDSFCCMRVQQPVSGLGRLALAFLGVRESLLMPQAGAGLLYLLSCLAKFGDMRAEMEAAGAVDVLLELLSTCHDTKVQVILSSAPAVDKCP